MEVMAATSMRQKCPTCGKVAESNPEGKVVRTEFFPFCSQRCRLVDLGEWLDGRYRMTIEPGLEDVEQA